MLARWRTCSTLSGEFSRRCCVNKKENVERVANYLRTMGTTWRALSRPNVMIMGQIACLAAYGDHQRRERAPRGAGHHTLRRRCADGVPAAGALLDICLIALASVPRVQQTARRY